jgi:hypothetical protein
MISLKTSRLLTPKNSKKKNGFTVNEATHVGRNAPILGTPPFETNANSPNHNLIN